MAPIGHRGRRRFRHAPARKAAIVVLALIVSVAVIPGFAATLGGITSKQLGAGNAVVAACDTNGFTVSYTTSAGSVSAVNLGGIADPGCEGGQLSLTLADASGGVVVSGGPQTVPTDAGTVDNAMSVAVTSTPAAAVTAIHVVVTGP